MKRKKLTAIYLAAGNSCRMGRNKLALPLGHSFLGCKALQTAIEVHLFEKIFVIIKAADPLKWLLPLEKLDSLVFVPIHESTEGLSVSLKKGIEHVMDSGADGAMIFPSDLLILRPSPSRTNPWLMTLLYGAFPVTATAVDKEELNQPRYWSLPSR